MAMEVSIINSGPLISKFVATNFAKVISKMKSYKEKNYEQALIEAFMKFDELLKDEKVNNFLKKQLKENKENYQMEYKLDIEYNTIQKSPNFNFSLLSSKDSKSDSNKTTPRNSSEEGSKDILTYENSKLEISLKSFPKEVKGNDLIATNMGTTANILLIRNNTLYLSNVGDSLAVLYKNKQAIKLNQEHKTSLQSENSRISKSGATIINNRIDGRLNLTRAIGIIYFT